MTQRMINDANVKIIWTQEGWLTLVNQLTKKSTVDQSQRWVRNQGFLVYEMDLKMTCNVRKVLNEYDMVLMKEMAYVTCSKLAQTK